MSAWLTVRAAADRLGVAERTLTDWCRLGRVPATARRQPAGYQGRWLVAASWVDAAGNAGDAGNAETPTSTRERATMST